MRILHQFGMAVTRLLKQSSLQGTTVVYAAKDQEVCCYECDYEIRIMAETNKPEVRAVRQGKIYEGKPPAELPESRVHDELVVIFGPKMPAKKAAETLEALARKIRQHGLVTGLDERGRLVIEPVT